MTERTREAALALFPALAAAMVRDFNKSSIADPSFFNEDGCSLEVGSKYARIVRVLGGQRSCGGFICLEDITVKGKQFAVGDLLKSASWKAPALNFARGNIFELDSPVTAAHIRWTGIG